MFVGRVSCSSSDIGLLLRKDFCPCGEYCRFYSTRFPFSDDLDTMTKPILEIENLNAFFPGKQVLYDVSLTVQVGRKLALVGESGSGKTVLAQGIMRLNPLVSFEGRLKFDGNDLLTQSERALQKLRGREIGMVFQEPMTALNPVMRVGAQIAEVLTLHLGLDKKQAWGRAVELLAETGIREPEQKAFAYPFQLSGGQRQRAMIAMAVAAEPKLLIADEPTTALDVTIQAQIMDLLLDLQKKECMSLILITHDLALVAEAAHRIIVMYAGQVVEEGRAEEIFREPKHPYTQALLHSLPEFAEGKARLASLPGVVPGRYDRPTGCLLNPRCPYATEHCRRVEPKQHRIGMRKVKCHTPLNAQGKPVEYQGE